MGSTVECSTGSLGLDLLRKQISEGRRKTLGTSDHGIDEGSKVSRSEDLGEYHHLSPAMTG